MISLSRLLLFSLVLMLLGCSSAPKPEYDVTTYQNMALKLMAFADRKRQEAHWGQAIELYLEAEKYAMKRNDKYLLGLSQLKRAAIAIVQGRQTEAALLLAGVEQMVEFEGVDLAQAVVFVKARMALSRDDKATAKALFIELEQFYQQDIARQIYYRLQRWKIDYQAVELSQVEADLAMLRDLYQQHQLDNVEIYSFALLSYLQWQVDTEQDETTMVLAEALEHFSRLELSNKIAECYLLGAKYYRRQGNVEKADYYQTQASKINLVL